MLLTTLAPCTTTGILRSLREHMPPPWAAAERVPSRGGASSSRQAATGQQRKRHMILILETVGGREACRRCESGLVRRSLDERAGGQNLRPGPPGVRPRVVRPASPGAK